MVACLVLLVQDLSDVGPDLDLLDLEALSDAAEVISAARLVPLDLLARLDAAEVISNQ